MEEADRPGHPSGNPLIPSNRPYTVDAGERSFRVFPKRLLADGQFLRRPYARWEASRRSLSSLSS